MWQCTRWGKRSATSSGAIRPTGAPGPLSSSTSARSNKASTVAALASSVGSSVTLHLPRSTTLRSTAAEGGVACGRSSLTTRAP